MELFLVALGRQFGEYVFIAGLSCPCQMVERKGFLIP